MAEDEEYVQSKSNDLARMESSGRKAESKMLRFEQAGLEGGSCAKWRKRSRMTSTLWLR